MSLRSRLIVAFLLLSVVPLSAVTLITYRSWVQTFEKAAQREATQSAGDISRRMERITADVGRRMDRMLVEARSNGGSPESAAMRQRVAPLLGDAAALVERVEFQPMGLRPNEPPPPPGAPAPSGAPTAGDGGQRRGGPPLPPWIGPDGQPRFASPGRFGRGGRGGPWGRNGAPPPDPQVIVVDVQQAIEDARRIAATEAAATVPDVTPMVEESLAALPAAQAAVKAATDSAAAATAGAATAGAANAAARQMEMQVAGRRVEINVTQDGHVVGKAHAMLNLDRTLRTAFAFSRRDLGEIPFAIDTTGVLHNPDPADRQTLESFGAASVGSAAADGRARRGGDWLIVSRKEQNGLIFGIARPIGESLREIRRAAAKNLAFGLMAIVLALIGIVPISHGMTRDLTSLDAGVRELAAGNFQARVPVRSKDEFGSLAAAFNQMAADLERHQALVVEQERLRRELELSRLIQSEMLPRAPLRLGAAEIKGISIPAREVGGDFFNYFALPDGRLALLVGDVSGKGVSAALLMANVQATLRARLPLEADLARLAAELDREIDETTPGAVYLTLFLGILDASRQELRYVNAGHNPQFVVHAGGGFEVMGATGLPIALYPGQPYVEEVVPARPGDLLFFYTDGLVEAEDEHGDMFGIDRLKGLLGTEQTQGIDTVLHAVEDAVRRFRGDHEPMDDATMMALRLNG